MTKDRIISDSAKIIDQKDTITSLEESIPNYVEQARNKVQADSLYRERMVESALLASGLSVEFRNIYGIEAPYYDISTCAVGMDLSGNGNLQYDELIEWEDGDERSKLFTDCPEVLLAAAFDFEKNNFFVSGRYEPDTYTDIDTANAKAMDMVKNNESDANNNVYYNIMDEEGNIETNIVATRNLQRFFVDSQANEEGSPFPDPFCPPGLLRWSGEKLYNGICKPAAFTEFSVYNLINSDSDEYTISSQAQSYCNDAVDSPNVAMNWPNDTWAIDANFDANNHVSWTGKVTGSPNLRYNYNVPDVVLNEAKMDGRLYYPVDDSMLIGITPEKYYRFFRQDNEGNFIYDLADIPENKELYVNFELCQFEKPWSEKQIVWEGGWTIKIVYHHAQYTPFCTGTAAIKRMKTSEGDDTLKGNTILSIAPLQKPNGPTYLPKTVVQHQYVKSTNGFFKRLFTGAPKYEYGYSYSDDFHPFKIVIKPIENITIAKNDAIKQLVESYKDIISKYQNFKSLGKKYDEVLDLDRSMATMQAVINAYESGGDYRTALKARLDYVCGGSYSGSTNYDDPSNRANIINKYMRLNRDLYAGTFSAIRCRLNKRGGTLRELVTILGGMNIAIKAADDKKSAIGSLSNEISAFKITAGFGSNTISVQLADWEIALDFYDNIYRLANVIITGDDGVGYQENKVIDVTLVSPSYEKTTDTEIQPEKVYYANVDNIIYIPLGSYDNEYLPYYYEYNSTIDEYNLTKDTQVNPGKTYYLKLDGGRKYLKIKPLSASDLEYYYEGSNNRGAMFEVLLQDPISTDIEGYNPRIVRVVQNK